MKTRITVNLTFLAAIFCWMISSSVAVAADVSNRVTVTRTGFVLNRATDTFDSVITIRNSGPNALVGPMKFIITSLSPVGASVANKAGQVEAGYDYLEIPLPNGLIQPNQSIATSLQIYNPQRLPVSYTFTVDSAELVAGQTSTVLVQGFDGTTGEAVAPRVGANFVVSIDGVSRGVTNANGELSVQVPVGAVQASVTSPPLYSGSAQIGTLTPGQIKTIAVTVYDGGEGGFPCTLRFDQLRQLILPKGATNISLRFFASGAQVKASDIQSVSLDSDLGDSSVGLTKQFSLATDGSLVTNAAAVFQILAGRTGKQVIDVAVSDAQGRFYTDRIGFYIGAYSVQGRVVAPPSQANLPLGNIRVDGAILNSDLTFSSVTDAQGVFYLPTLPPGALSLNAVTDFNNKTFTGAGETTVASNFSLQLVLRGASDVAANVAPIVIQQNLSAKVGQSLSSPSSAVQKEREALDKIYKQKTVTPKVAAKSLAVVGPPQSVSVSASSATRDQAVSQTASITVPKGTSTVTLKGSIRPFTKYALVIGLIVGITVLFSIWWLFRTPKDSKGLVNILYDFKRKK